GSLFGPIIFVWFSVLAILGIFEIVKNPDVLIAINPFYAIEFIIQNKLAGFLVLGAVFLVVTGAEALYADLGHFGSKPIRLTWIGIVLPALLLNYFGQGALLLSKPSQAYHPFYGMVPSWAIIPMVVLATTATIIASQAVITGAFSLTRQSIQLGFLPRMRVIHTSAEQIGQIYVPQVNWLLMIATIFLVVEFRTSDKLAAAYGVAVTSTMLITTLLFYVIARRKWGWSKLVAGGLFIIFFITDLAFFGANMSKIMHGAWFPLVVAGAIFALMSTWQRGRQLLYEQLSKEALTLEDFIKSLSIQPVDRIRGQAVFLSGNPGIIPRALLHNLKHNKVLHSEIIFLHISTQEVPRIPLDQKLDFEKLGSGFYKVTARYGFMEEPNIVKILTLIREKGVDFKPNQISYFLGREMVLPKEKSGMSKWRTKLFGFLSHNAFGFTAYYDIPPNQVVELGSQIRL
ncbi:MAG: KUP/HAK/KT family potassium transporter, partial [Ignavibacteriaceae bacterium]